MKQFRFILLCATIAVISSSLTGCKKGVYDEKAALSAQKDLLQFKYDQEIKLENLRQTGASALETQKQNLQYSFLVRARIFNDSLSRESDAIYYKKRDIIVKVYDYITNAPVNGAEVTIPTIVGTFIKVKTDSLGYARFSPNMNIPRPASAIATKDGYASGSIFGAIYGDANSIGYGTIRIWDVKTAPNTVKGKIYIENDLTNDEPEVAKNAFVNAFTFIDINEQTQRFDFSATTDNNGNYSMKLPNIPNGYLSFAYTAIEGTSKMYVNGYVPGMDTVPTLKSIDATYFLGTNNVSLNDRGYTFGVGSVEQPENTNFYQIPYSVDRYHVAAAADSNGRGHYQRGLNFTESTLTTSATSDTAYLSNTYTYTTSDLTSGASYSANNSSPSTRYTSKYLAGTKVRDTVTATLYDLLANADGFWKTAPTLKFVLNTDSTTTVGKKFKYIESLIQVKGGGTTKKADVNFTHNQTLYNLVKTVSGTSSNSYKQSYINDGFANIYSNQINNGKTYEFNMSFGAGKLKTAVR
jgi:hypothetical protein